MTLDPDFERAFASCLLQPSHPAPVGLVSGTGESTDDRYNVYRNNVTVSLIEALTATYPAVQRITGSDFFRAMARFYVRAKPPTSPLLFEYGNEFADFIGNYEYAREMPWLPDVARIERAWLDAYHAADVHTLSADALARVEPASLSELRFAAHPATRIVRSAYPAVQIFVMNRRDEPVSDICSGESEDALVTRPDDEVVVTHLPPGGAEFLSALIRGGSLRSAVLEAFDAAPEFDLEGNMAGMIAVGVFSAIVHGEEQ